MVAEQRAEHGKVKGGQTGRGPVGRQEGAGGRWSACALPPAARVCSCLGSPASDGRPRHAQSVQDWASLDRAVLVLLFASSKPPAPSDSASRKEKEKKHVTRMVLFFPTMLTAMARSRRPGVAT